MVSPKQSKKALLHRLGADEENFVFEVVVSTCDATGKPNAAPMGIRFVDDKAGKKRILIKPFKSTTTHKNLSSQREAVVNVTSDPEIFYRTTFKRGLLREGEAKTVFSNSKTVEPPRIKGCDAYIEVSVASLKDAEGEENRSDALCDLKLVEVKKSSAKLYCRAPYILMEMMIHATRVREFVSQGLKDEAVELVKLIDNYRKLIHRVAPGSRYENVTNEIVDIILSGRRREA
nr:DUF447 family protein [Candidatus Njordarchaeum guaymaensis]